MTLVVPQPLPYSDKGKLTKSGELNVRGGTHGLRIWHKSWSLWAGVAWGCFPWPPPISAHLFTLHGITPSHLEVMYPRPWGMKGKRDSVQVTQWAMLKVPLELPHHPGFSFPPPTTRKYVTILTYSLFLFSVLGFQFRVLHLLSSHSSTSPFFCFSYFSVRISLLFAPGGP
jgi:hypothetical protein